MSTTHFSGPVDSTAGFIGDLTGDIVTTVESAEHGTGAIGTGAIGAPQTYRWIENGVIITQIKFDITGLGVKGTAANDVIGIVSTAPDAYIGKNVVATNGVIFKAELTCIETPGEGTATITQDIDIATNASGTLGYDEAAGAARLINAGSVSIGQTVVNLVPALTANHYYYIVEADTAATTGIYDAGMFILTTYGHPVLA